MVTCMLSGVPQAATMPGARSCIWALMFSMGSGPPAAPPDGDLLLGVRPGLLEAPAASSTASTATVVLGMVGALDASCGVDDEPALVVVDGDVVVVPADLLVDEDATDAEQREDDEHAERGLRDAGLLFFLNGDGDRLLLGDDFALESRLFREGSELLPLLDRPGLPRDLVAQGVVERERIRGDLLEELDGRERSVIHLVAC